MEFLRTPDSIKIHQTLPKNDSYGNLGDRQQWRNSFQNLLFSPSLGGLPNATNAPGFGSPNFGLTPFMSGGNNFLKSPNFPMGDYNVFGKGGTGGLVETPAALYPFFRRNASTNSFGIMGGSPELENGAKDKLSKEFFNMPMGYDQQDINQEEDAHCVPDMKYESPFFNPTGNPERTGKTPVQSVAKPPVPAKPKAVTKETNDVSNSNNNTSNNLQSSGNPSSVAPSAPCASGAPGAAVTTITYGGNYNVNYGGPLSYHPGVAIQVPILMHYHNTLSKPNGEVDYMREFKKKTREAALYRFRQKRKERKNGTFIRYSCRKKLADARPRIKGRFVKSEKSEDVQVVPL